MSLKSKTWYIFVIILVISNYARSEELEGKQFSLNGETYELSFEAELPVNAISTKEQPGDSIVILKDEISTDLSTIKKMQIIFNKGSIKKNINQTLSEFGYTIGLWNFGTDAFEYDWVVEKSYTLTQNLTLDEYLQFIKKNYNIAGTQIETMNVVNFSYARNNLAGDYHE